MASPMSLQGGPTGHAQQFEQAIATLFACRNVIKYNSTLSEEQKKELFTEIDRSLQFLQNRLVANASIESVISSEQLPQPFVGLASVLQLAKGQSEDEKDYGDKDHLLRNFFHLYSTFLTRHNGKDIETFVTRYNAAMTSLDEAQSVIQQRFGYNPNYINIEDYFHSVRGFVTDLYCIFTEFASSITNIIQGHEMYIDTEEVSSMQEQLRSGDPAIILENTAALVRVYQTQQHLQRRKGSLESRASDATALLIFLEEHLPDNSEKRDEIVAQLKSVIKLVGDMSYLLSDYEHTVSALLIQKTEK
jgi:hypothetical protein